VKDLEVQGVAIRSTRGSKKASASVSTPTRAFGFPARPPYLLGVGDVRTEIRDFALSLPEAVEDHPWGEDVAKVRGKVFVFLGAAGSATQRITVKLVESHGHALSIEGAEPTGYGLGKSGWVTVPLEAKGLSRDLLCDWIEESYRVVAPKQLLATLDEID
jgi:predicted DNA-binding protein (MmcQ/YjbR family)